MTSREEAVVLKFIGAFRDTWPADFDVPLSLTTDDVYYQSIVPTTEPVKGRAAIKAKWQSIKEKFGDQKHQMISSASNGRFVFTERIDYTHTNGVWASIPLVAVFEVNEQGKIYAWREYLDGANVARQIGMKLEEIESALQPAKA
jgi:limonene-1,2-epoxide hydrolase